MAQVNLAGVGVEEAAKKEREQLDLYWKKRFYEETLNELRRIRDNIEYYDDLAHQPLGDDGLPDFELEKIMGAWWYCNHIVGWNNEVPYQDKSREVVCGYDDVPDNELMADSIRSSLFPTRRDGIMWDKEYAIHRLNRAITEYEKDLADLPKLEDENMKPNFSISETELYEDDDEFEEPSEDDDTGEADTGVYHGQISTIYDTDKVRRGPKALDKAQVKLGQW